MRNAFRSVALVLGCLSFLAASVLRAQAPEPSVPPDVQALAKQDMADMAAGRFDAIEAQYNTQMAFALPKGKLAEQWAAMISQVGAFKDVEGSSLRQAQGYQLVVLTCDFANAALDAQFAFDPGGKLAHLHFTPHESTQPWVPPAYANPAAFKEQPITVSFSRWQLPGTLAMPAGAGPFPAVVLVQGSGPQDQDESIGANKPFKDLAWGLASRGIAVLRYVKRTRQYGISSVDDPTKMTVDDETINDARAAVSLLASQQGIDPHRIYVLGHSLGAYLAPRIAAGDAQVAGIILLAANARPLEQVAADQIRYLVGVEQVPQDEAQRHIADIDADVKTIESPDLKPTDKVSFLGSQVYGTYWLDLRSYDPVAVAAQSSIPILILRGERDYQVTTADFDKWKKGLAGHTNVTFKSYTLLNHLFIPGEGVPSPKEYGQAGHVSGDVIADIVAWMIPASKHN